MKQPNSSMIIFLHEDGIDLMFRSEMAFYRKDGSIKSLLGAGNTDFLPRHIILSDGRNLKQVASQGDYMSVCQSSTTAASTPDSRSAGRQNESFV